MGFALVDSWQGQSPDSMPQRVPLGPAPNWPGAGVGASPTVLRLIAASLSCLVAYLVFSALSFWLANGAALGAPARLVDAIAMITPSAAAGVDRTVVTSGGRAGAAPAPPIAGASVVDTSEAQPFSILEWSVRPIAAPAPTAPNRGSAGQGRGVGNSAGDGTGGAGVYDPYAGAAPLRGGDAAGERPDDAALAALDGARHD